MRDLILPLDNSVLSTLRAGEKLLLTGSMATARDQAHQLMTSRKEVPFDLERTPIFYMGPTPAPPGRSCGSCGPTTSSRMEPFIEDMLKMGMKIVIGKGDMSSSTRELFLHRKAVYLAAVGGAGAFYSTLVTQRRVVAWEHLGPEAVSIITVKNFPVFVAWDLNGGNLFKQVEKT